MIENWLSQYIPNGDLAVDVGANEGDWTEVLLNKFKKVVALEPDIRASCKIRLLLNGPNLNLIEGVAGDVDGEVEMFFRPHSGHNSLLVDHPIEHKGNTPIINQYKVKSYRLDTLFPEGADFVKIDTEGFEPYVLRGCVENWARTLFIVECHDNYELVAVELERLNKKIEKIAHPYPGTHPGHCWAIASPK